MPTKKHKPKERHPITLRFDDQEKALLDADRRSIGGVPGSFSAYAKHAVNQYPKLRKLEEALRLDAAAAPENGTSADSESIYARDVLKQAGLS